MPSDQLLLAAAVIGAVPALLVGMANVRHHRATRWDEPRRLVYSRFVAAVTDFNGAAHSETLARWTWLRAADKTMEMQSNTQPRLTTWMRRGDAFTTCMPS